MEHVNSQSGRKLCPGTKKTSRPWGMEIGINGHVRCGSISTGVVVAYSQLRTSCQLVVDGLGVNKSGRLLFICTQIERIGCPQCNPEISNAKRRSPAEDGSAAALEMQVQLCRAPWRRRRPRRRGSSGTSKMGARTRALRPPAAATGGATLAAHELFVCSDGRGNPSSREAAAPAAHRRTSPRPQPAAMGGRTRGLGLRLKQTKSNQ